LDNNQDNFQLQRFTTSENIAKSFRGGGTFLTHTVEMRTEANSNLWADRT